MSVSRVITIRPEPGCTATVERGMELGLRMEAYPMFEIAAVEWDAPDPDQFDGLLVGSANAFRHGGDGLVRLRGLPVHAVGEATARAARAAGFAVEQVGQGGLQPVLDSLAGKEICLLRLAGRDHVALAPAAGIRLTERICYESNALRIEAGFAESLHEGALILLHSANAASHFANECKRLRIELAKIDLACLGPRIAAAAGGGWRRVKIANSPTETALLALARDMCHGNTSQR